MHPLTRLRTDSQDVLLLATRRSQAWVIVGVDQLARDDRERPRPLGRLWRFQLNLLASLVGEPSGIVDQSYGHLQQVLALHREFGQRLLEILETLETPDHSPAAPSAAESAQVIPFAAAARRSH